MHTDTYRAYQPGRHIIGRLPHGEDLLAAVRKMGEAAAVATAVFSIVGSITSATYGVYDQTQQVYITDQYEKPFEIASCTGSICRQQKETIVQAHAVLIDNDGHIAGGRMFSPTCIFAAEISLKELVGPELQREYDAETGLMLWTL